MDLLDFWAWPHALFSVEAGLVALSFAFAWRAPRLEKALGKLARHRLSPLVVGLFALALRAALLPVEPIPQPTVHDEFSYLLAADTFLHGRVANPPHPFWEHFETFHEDQRPTYVSMYPPGQGLVLAAGRLLTGEAFAGVWLSMGALCALLCWMLRGWFPPGWALLGGVLAAIRLGAFSYWDNSYWGGAVGALGGALLLGALPRLLRTSRACYALLAAMGIVVLANTRQYEGSVLSLVVILVIWRQRRRLCLRAILPPAAAVLLFAVACMAYYNWRAFGSPIRIPHLVNRETYAVAPYFVFESMRPAPAYRNSEMRNFYLEWEASTFNSARTLRGFLDSVVEKPLRIWCFFYGPVLTAPMIALAWTWNSRRTRLLLIIGSVVVGATLLVPYFSAHYVSPLTPLFYALMIQGTRVLWQWRPAVVRAIPVICVVLLLVRVGIACTGLPHSYGPRVTWESVIRMRVDREAVADALNATGGRHLVIVRYALGHDPLREYVYNDADIDASPIVWARDLGPDRNASLMAYFKGRKVWFLDVDPELALHAYP